MRRADFLTRPHDWTRAARQTSEPLAPARRDPDRWVGLALVCAAGALAVLFIGGWL